VIVGVVAAAILCAYAAAVVAVWSVLRAFVLLAVVVLVLLA